MRKAVLSAWGNGGTRLGSVLLAAGLPAPLFTQAPLIGLYLEDAKDTTSGTGRIRTSGRIRTGGRIRTSGRIRARAIAVQRPVLTQRMVLPGPTTGTPSSTVAPSTTMYHRSYCPMDLLCRVRSTAAPPTTTTASLGELSAYTPISNTRKHIWNAYELQSIRTTDEDCPVLTKRMVLLVPATTTTTAVHSTTVLPTTTVPNTTVLPTAEVPTTSPAAQVRDQVALAAGLVHRVATWAEVSFRVALDMTRQAFLSSLVLTRPFPGHNSQTRLLLAMPDAKVLLGC
eukprot:3332118-Rhodomonas_salina.2